MVALHRSSLDDKREDIAMLLGCLHYYVDEMWIVVMSLVSLCSRKYFSKSFKLLLESGAQASTHRRTRDGKMSLNALSNAHYEDVVCDVSVSQMYRRQMAECFYLLLKYGSDDDVSIRKQDEAII